MQLWQILILAFIQGVAEFLPISSSGHVVIVAQLLAGGSAAQLDVSDVNIVLHVGTLFSILVIYWRRVVQLLGEDRRSIGLLLVGTLPGVAVGVPMKKFGSALLESPLLAGLLLILTGVMLLWVSRRRFGNQEHENLGYGRAFLIGAAQATAVLPGLSRSGATISAGLRLGLSPSGATTFSFLLAIPIIAGGGAYELLSMFRDQPALTTPPLYLAVGAVVAFVVGLVSLAWLIRCIEHGRLQWFAAWCIPVGLCVVVWQLLTLWGS
jgi:undecaprenyl-diphosphatase